MRTSRIAVLVLLAAAIAAAGGACFSFGADALAAEMSGADQNAVIERSSPAQLSALQSSAATLSARIERSGLTAANVASADALVKRLESAGGGYFPFAADLSLAAKAARPGEAVSALAGISRTLAAALSHAPRASQGAGGSTASADREALKGIFASGGYNLSLKPKGWSLTDAMWVGGIRLLRRLIDYLSGSRGSGVLLMSRAFLAVVLFLVIAVALFAALWFYVQYRDRGRVHEFEGEAVESLRMESPEIHRQKARELALRGEYRLALQQVFLALLSELELLKLVAYDRSRTNLEYSQDFGRRAKDTESYAVMQALVRAYDRAWYGGAPCGSDDVSDLDARTRTLVERVKQSSIAAQ